MPMLRSRCWATHPGHPGSGCSCVRVMCARLLGRGSVQLRFRVCPLGSLRGGGPREALRGPAGHGLQWRSRCGPC